MNRLGGIGARIVVGLVALAVVAGGLYYFVFTGDGTKSVTAQFPQAVGIYKGTPVRILGVEVGTVSSVQAKGDYVEVKMSYDDRYNLPQNVSAVEVANSLVSDRYIQLTPVFKPATANQAKLTAVNQAVGDNHVITQSHTAGPAELDQIYGALNKLSVALGPKGANKPSGGAKDGALSTLLTVAAANLKGNGAALGNSISNLSRAAQTLADNKGDLFATIANLAKFTKTLQASDGQVSRFNNQLATVSQTLADERTDLGTALHELAGTLDNVASFVTNNAGRFHRSVQGLDSLVGVLNKDKGALNESLAVGAPALANLVHSYDPALGTISTRSNLASLTSPTQVCELVYGLLNIAKGGAGLLNNLLGSVTKQLDTACTQLLAGRSAGAISDALAKLLGVGTDRLAGVLDGLVDGRGAGLGGLIPG